METFAHRLIDAVNGVLWSDAPIALPRRPASIDAVAEVRVVVRES
ncbi:MULTISPECIES: hypothetical protein [Burkholderia cepacia complex]|nr:hypothetical protein [Burkholderia cenocepacia]CAG2259900.1 hypothetical protein BCCR75389_00329 [Burkholderia cenocepacia]CAG2260028.1 hypothetical protein BCCR75386_00336 [Burkholderia cenocepacia]CAG2260072.1 hypothetical protein BCCR75388_00336 [Burkholderia cenocepacia]CAG2260173.1 hypothetical protein BCCR75387_00336 [Burkholderia cenocepacia]CAG2260178.1 hypothetical protein BCCR75384_00336 [Burkholderia cenocepacia]